MLISSKKKLINLKRDTVFTKYGLSGDTITRLKDSVVLYERRETDTYIFYIASCFEDGFRYNANVTIKKNS